MIRLPKCRFCGKPWMPKQGAVALLDYCHDCSEERREIVRQKLDPIPVTRETDCDYHLPRRRNKILEGLQDALEYAREQV